MNCAVLSHSNSDTSYLNRPPPSYSIENNLFARSKEIRKCLTDDFLASSAQIDKMKDPKVSTETLVALAISANEKFNQVKAVINADSPLIEAHQQFIDKLASKAAENFKGKLVKLIDRKIGSSTSPQEVEFLEKVVNVAIENIENRTKNEGFLFTVTNAKGVTSYLIGSLHKATQSMTQNQQMLDAVQNSNELITEIGYGTQAKSELESGDLYGPSNKLRYATDLTLTKLAESRNITISGLSTIPEQKSAYFKLAGSMSSSPIKAETLQRITAHAPYLFHENADAWQEGSEKKILRIMKELNHPKVVSYIDDLTENWSVGLIKKLQETEHPISIVVGTGHCLGDKGLPKIFSDAGLSVERKRN